MAKTAFIDGNPALGVMGTVVDAAFLNAIFQHRHDGLNQDGSAPTNFAGDSGVANAYVIALTPALAAYIPGMPIIFAAAHANTGASTLAINALTAEPIVHSDGSALAAGDIPANSLVTVIWNGINFQIEGSLTPGQFVESLSGSPPLGPNGYLKLPNGLIIQFGAYGVSSPGGSSAVTFPIAFPNNIFQIVVSGWNATSTNSAAWLSSGATLEGFTGYCATVETASFIAIGN